MRMPATAAVHESRSLHHNCYTGLLYVSGVWIYRGKEELSKLEVPHFTVSCSAHTLRTQAFSIAILSWRQKSLIYIRKQQKYDHSMNWWYSRRKQIDHITRNSVLILKSSPELLVSVFGYFLKLSVQFACLLFHFPLAESQLEEHLCTAVKSCSSGKLLCQKQAGSTKTESPENRRYFYQLIWKYLSIFHLHVLLSCFPSMIYSPAFVIEFNVCTSIYFQVYCFIHLFTCSVQSSKTKLWLLCWLQHTEIN